MYWIFSSNDQNEGFIFNGVLSEDTTGEHDEAIFVVVK